ncbi:MAG: fructosamine kinase family protein [Gallionellaceae bacterium]|jgi:fructosamine-3-kinase|nr:fructosamine kinase family protein [Gallionellaceae bacterium]
MMAENFSSLLPHLSAAISAATHRAFTLRDATPVSGGDINETWRLDGVDGSRYFLKLNKEHLLPMFIAEAEGLTALAATRTLRIPQPIAHGSAAGRSFLVLEYLEFSSRGNARLLGEQLAALHRNTAERFGFAHDNFIGATPQANDWRDDWITFWRDQRLGAQLQLAERNGYDLRALGDKLMDKLPEFFDGYAPRPSLLHGDLWGGNHAYTADGAPAIFDPAAYYGDREADIAMTELFGGYSADFYAAYRAAWPLDSGYAARKPLYNLYHILNHANLFGGGYARQAEKMMRELLTGYAART